MRTCICVIIKDEHQCLEEWINHHLNLGIDEIFLFEDYNSISHKDIIEQYGDKVHLQSIDYVLKHKDCKITLDRGPYRQDALFTWFPLNYGKEFDWVLFNDIDEFLILKQPLHELLKEYDDKPAILLHWITYGANGHIKKLKGKVMDNYTSCIANPIDNGWTHKSFCNCKHYTSWEQHVHKIKGGVFPINEFGDHKAWLNHYFTKSWEEWKEKILSRGCTAKGHRKIHQFFILNHDMLHLKNDLLLEIAIDNATNLGFNQHINSDKSTKYFHFCWFGGNEFSELHLTCIESWKKYLSDDYTVCLWNEHSFDYNECDFTREAYYAKKWVYVSDYVRLWCIYNFGGVYFDTDVELLKPIDDLPTNFFAIEKDYNLLTTKSENEMPKHNKSIKDLLDTYDSLNLEEYENYNLINTKLSTNYFIEEGCVMDYKNIYEYIMILS